MISSQADAPAAYWRLDETSGTSATDSTGGRTGTYTGGYTLNQTGALSDVTDKAVSLERGLLSGALLFLVGFAIDAAVLIHWLRKDLGPINSLRPALLAMTLMMVGAQTGFAAFFLSLFRADRAR